LKIIECMREIKSTKKKIDDTLKLLSEAGADLEHHKPKYGTPEEQTAQVVSWLDRVRSLTDRISELRLALSRTNNSVPVTIVIDEKPITKTISEWIYRRQELAMYDLQAWKIVGAKERTLRPEQVQELDANKNPVMVLKNVRRFYNVREREHQMEVFSSEPSVIDGALEVANATTDIVDLA